jgi:4-hydroxybenzoate polyprenyltransferase
MIASNKTPSLNRLKPYLSLMRIDKPVGFWLLLWPMYWALLISGSGNPSKPIVFWMTLGCFLMRSAGCVFNDWADRHWDGKVRRTKNRPLPQGLITPSAALLLFFLLILCAFLVVLQLNQLTIILSFVALLLTLLYPLTKRFFKAPQIFLGFAFSMPVLMAFSATQNAIPATAWWLYAAAFIWPLAYDTLYAMVDRSDDAHLPIYSLAQTLASYDLKTISLLYTIFWLILIYLGNLFYLNQWFFGMMGGAGLMLLAQVWHARHRVPKNCFQAFSSNQWLGALIAIALMIGFRA